MVSPTQSTTYRGLLRLAVTVFLNLVLLIAVTGWAAGQTFHHEIGGSSTTFGLWVNLDSTGWRVLLPAQIVASKPFKYSRSDDSPEMWYVSNGQLGLQVIEGFGFDYSALNLGGGFVMKGEGFYSAGVKHWLILSVLFVLSAIHHRRLVTRLIRRHPDSKVSIY